MSLELPGTRRGPSAASPAQVRAASRRDPDGADPRRGGGQHQPGHRQRRVAVDRGGAGHQSGGAEPHRRRVHPGVGLVGAVPGRAGRPLRPQAGHDAGRRPVHPDVAAGRLGTHRHGADRGPRERLGCRRAAVPDHPVADLELFRGGARTRAIALWSGIGGGCSALGPLLGGLLLGRFWWGSMFLVSVPIAVLVVVLAGLWLPRRAGETSEPVIDHLGEAYRWCPSVPWCWRSTWSPTTASTAPSWGCSRSRWSGWPCSSCASGERPTPVRPRGAARPDLHHRPGQRHDHLGWPARRHLHRPAVHPERAGLLAAVGGADHPARGDLRGRGGAARAA